MLMGTVAVSGLLIFICLCNMWQGIIERRMLSLSLLNKQVQVIKEVEWL